MISTPGPDSYYKGNLTLGSGRMEGCVVISSPLSSESLRRFDGAKDIFAEEMRTRRP